MRDGRKSRAFIRDWMFRSHGNTDNVFSVPNLRLESSLISDTTLLKSLYCARGVALKSDELCCELGSRLYSSIYC
jgi:hypothetical protein